MCRFGGVRRGNYLEEPTGKAEVEVRVIKLKMERQQIEIKLFERDGRGVR